MNPNQHDALRSQHHAHRDSDRLLTIKEVAELTRLPVATLRFKRYDGTGPRSFRLGRRVMYWHSDVLGWIEVHYNDDGPQAA
jgi:predicted DNA-binding transcriptional regulator AlpA